MQPKAQYLGFTYNQKFVNLMTLEDLLSVLYHDLLVEYLFILIIICNQTQSI